MNITNGLRTLALLAFVVLSTTVILKPELAGGAAGSDQVLDSVVALSHG